MNVRPPCQARPAGVPPPIGVPQVGIPEEIAIDDLLAAPAPVTVDVRAPAEYEDDHIPGSSSVPLFDDEERAVVGTLYRHAGEPQARRWGEQRVRERLGTFTTRLERALELPPGGTEPIDEDHPRVVICARGGERSGAVCRLLRGLGHPVRRLRGGYRSYRRMVRERLAVVSPPGPVVINGLTGCGKTRLLHAITRRFPRQVVDLEGLAEHRSSVLGDIGLTPVSQKRFESRLAAALGELRGRWSLFEWEARRLGNREIPSALYDCLRNAPQIEIQATLARRVEILMEEYLAGGRGTEEIEQRLPALHRFPAIGAAGVSLLEGWLRDGDPQRAVRFLLERHYDPRYQHGNRRLTFQKTFRLRGIEETAAEIVDWLERRR